MNAKVNYEELISQYNNSDSLMYKKLRIVDYYINQHIKNFEGFLDIGMGTGELINLEKNKFKYVYGSDIDEESVNYCKKRFNDDKNIDIIKGDIRDIYSCYKFEDLNVITCLDVLEHINYSHSIETLNIIYDMLKKDGIFIFSGPGIYEKLRISLGLSPTHVHSHSSYSWAKLIQDSNFEIISVESVEFPFLKNDNFLRKKLHLLGKCCLIVSKRG